MSEYNVRVPPDSTGKRIASSVFLEIDFTNLTGSFAVGDTITCVTSGVTGDVVNIEASSIYVLLAHESPLATTDGEDINIGVTKQAEASGAGTPYYNQAAVIAGGNNPFNKMDVDHTGAASVRFPEGAPQFDAFGKLQSSQATVLGEYINSYERDDKNWWYEETEGGSPVTGNVAVEHIAASQGTLFKTGVNAGDKAAATTHLYHKYQLGTSQLIEVTAAVGDTGKAGVTRMWGYGDTNDGLFFKLEDTTLSVFMRSSTIANHTVAQANWNKDRLDGSGGVFNPSGHQLDITKDNIYWIDFQWLGAGRVRFGVLIEGVRITCHEMYHANQYTQPYMRTGTLPLHYGQVNTGTPGSASELRVWCGVVKSEGAFEPNRIEHYHHIRQRENADGGIYKMYTFNWHPGRALFTVRPKLTVNGIDNRTVAIPRLLSFHNESNTSMFIQARRGARLLSSPTPTWIDFHSESHLEYSEDGEIDQDNRGVQVGMWAIPPNSTENVDLSTIFDYRKERILLTADNDQEAFQYVFTCWNMNSIAGGADAGTYTVNLTNEGSPSVATITRVAGPAFNAPASNRGVAFSAGMGLRIRNSTNNQNDHYYIITSVTADVMEIEQTNGDAATFIAESGTAGVTLQGGDTGFAFGSLTIEEIIP